MRQTLISFDLRGDFGVFKKPDVNEGLQLTFNILHKPALLGILGAIAGLEGYQRRGVFPVYYQTLRDLKVGIEPLEHDKGNFVKTALKYTNTVGYANADGNLIVTEQTLRLPSYRVYLLLDLDDAVQSLLHDRIWAAEAEYLPYFGKNECSIWWDTETVQKYDFEPFVATGDFQVNSIFIREDAVQSQQVRRPRVSFALRKVDKTIPFAYFERLPIDFYVGDPIEQEKSNLFSGSIQAKDLLTKPMKFVQYDLAEFAFTNWTLREDSVIDGLFQVHPTDGEQVQIVQLF
ncbi:MAG TPA: CRISPR-associated protein Cas5 [Saprospiraceae bacterium]|nr:CRISPR-associated protein Cas5 [Saprospiraceae bacterium]HND87326.1 CRISPR-associated protein Cas5 [Saprospiraceae bacterium]